MPPSLGGTHRWVITSKPLSRSALRVSRRQQRVLEHAAGQRDRVAVPSRSRRRGRRPDRRRRGGTGPPITPGRHPGPDVGDDRREHRAPDRSPPELGARQCRSDMRLHRGRGRATSPPARWPPAPRRRPPAGRRPAPTPRRTAGPCWTWRRSPARSRVDAAARRARRPGTRRTGGRSSAHASPARPQVRQRHPVRPQHADVPTGQRNVLQVASRR